MRLLVDNKSLGTFADEEGLKDFARSRGIDVNAINVTIDRSPLETRGAIRKEIYEKAGDTDSLLGTVSDSAGFLFIDALTRLDAEGRVADASGDDAWKQSVIEGQSALALRLGVADRATLLTTVRAILAKIDAQELTLPTQAKGLQSVLEDTASRGNAVTSALVKFVGPQPPANAPDPQQNNDDGGDSGST